MPDWRGKPLRRVELMNAIKPMYPCGFQVAGDRMERSSKRLLNLAQRSSKLNRRISTLVALLAACSSSGVSHVRAQEPAALQLSGDIAGAHDPSIGRDGGLYVVFTTGRAPGGGQFALRCSAFVRLWHSC